MPVKRGSFNSSRCQAKTKSGMPCAAPAIRGKRYCSLHLDPNRAKEIGRKGGLGNRHVYSDDGIDIQPPKSAQDVREMLSEVMAGIRANRIDPRIGNTLGYLGTAVLKAIETAELEQRITRLEAMNGTGSTNQETRKQ